MFSFLSILYLYAFNLVSCFSKDRQLKIKDLVLSTHDRAVRNCPWTMGLWKSYVLALERHEADHQTVSGKRAPQKLLFWCFSTCALILFLPSVQMFLKRR